MLRRVALVRALIAALFAVLALGATAAAPASGATASAERFAADTASWQRAYTTAVRQWGHTPCAGDVRPTWGGLEGDLNAVAAWSAVPGAAPSTFTACEVTFNTNLDWDYATFCSVVVHEVGHLLGHAHNDEPGHVMSHVTTTMVPACEQAATVRTASTTQTTRAKRRTPSCTRARIAKLRRSGKLARSACRRSAAALRR